jgi:hypothetical protein
MHRVKIVILALSLGHKNCSPVRLGSARENVFAFSMEILSKVVYGK